MVWELVLGFVVLVAASYVGTTMALGVFFGRERYVPDFEGGADEQSRSDETSGTDESSGAEESNGIDEANGKD